MSRTVVAVSLVASLTLGSSAWGEDKPRLTGHEEILEWLPEDSQTLFVVRGPFLIGQSAAKEIKTELDSFRFQLRRLMSVGDLGDEVADENVEKTLIGNPVMLSVEGSRKFRAPANFGMMPYEGAHILVFRNGVEAIMTALEKKAVRREEIEGQRVTVIEEKRDDDLWTTYVAQIKPGFIVLATHRDYLKEIMRRSAAKIKAKTRAFPVNLPEWKHVDTAAPFWGLRHYDRKDAANDPSSPLTARREANVPDDQAVGLVIALKDDVAEIQYLSTNKNALEIAAALWTLHDEQAPSRMIRTGMPGVVNVSFPLKQKSPSYNAILLALLQSLGHGISF
jgi:hypothetical protein